MDNIDIAIRRTLEAELLAVQALAETAVPMVRNAVALLKGRTGKIVVIGVGKSGYVGMKLAASLTSLGQLAVFLHPVEALHGDLGAVARGDVAIVFSHSGKSTEVIKIVKYIRDELKAEVIVITGSPEAPLTEHADAVISYRLVSEGCPLELAPMASTTASLVIGDLIASGLTASSSFQREDFARFHPGGSLGLSLKYVDILLTSPVSVPRVERASPFRDVVATIDKHKLGITAVVDGGKLVGSVTDGDVRRIITRGEPIESLTAAEVMHEGPKTVRRSNTLLEALSLMEDHKITSLFVVDERGALEGVIHMHHIIKDHVV